MHLWDKLSPDNRVVLHHILSLEGPDFQCQLHHTLKEHFTLSKVGMSSGFLQGPATIQCNTPAEAHFDTYCHLLNQVDDACAGGQTEIDLLMFLVSRLITKSQLQLFDAVHATANPSISTGVLELLQPSPQAEKLFPLLASLGNSGTETIKHMISTQLLTVLTLRFREAREAMFSLILNGSPCGSEGLKMVIELQEFGKSLRDADWCLEMLKPNFRNLIKSWPSARVATTWHKLRDAADSNSSKPFVALLDRYFAHHFIRPDPQQYGFQVIETLIDMWARPTFASSAARCRMSLLIASNGVDTAFKCRCIAQLSLLADDFIPSLLSTFESREAEPVRAIIDLTQLLASGVGTDIIQCWRPLLVHLIEQQDQNFIQQLTETLSADKWLALLEGLRIILSDPDWDSPVSQSMLQPSLHAWGELLKQHIGTVQKLESAIGKGPALYCILTGGDGPSCSTVLKILDTLSAPSIGKSSASALEYEIAALLAERGENADSILKAITCLRSMSFEGYKACEQIIKCHRDPLPPTADVVLAGYLHSEDITDGDKADLKTVAKVLQIHIPEDGLPSYGSIELNDEYLNEEINHLFEEAKRLESLRLALKSLDPDGMHKLLLSLGIEDTTPLDDMFSVLPPGMVDVVERISDSILEIQLPLIQLSTFTRQALGAPNANNLILRLQTDTKGLGFCIHFDDAIREAPAEAVHVPFFSSDELSGLNSCFCDTRPTPGLFHLSRTLHRRLQSQPASLVDIQDFMTTAVSTLYESCIICGASHTARLCRSSPCALSECQVEFSKTRLEVSLADMRQDPAVVDLLVTSIYAATTANKFDILPGHPVQDNSTIQRMLNQLPAVTKFQTAKYLESEVNDLTVGTRDLLVWVMNAFRGYLVSATGSLKIPSLPGAHQFFLANTNPEKEREFATRIKSGQTRRVLFHGTSLDRLYSILCQGLKEMSGTSLQRNGAHYGNGIYMAEEPATAWPYTQTVSKSWSNSQFSNFRVLLGCEYVGTATEASKGIFVLKDASALMVRYVFLMPQHKTVPVARHVVPAMESVFANLRAGTI